jgi:PadR family transcriptional regulator, regulatory protein PadR
MARRKNISRQTVSTLMALLEHPQSWRYGYDLIDETGLRSGTLYPILMRLHDQGYLDAEWRPSLTEGRPPRHVYRLTATGRALALALQTTADGATPGRLAVPS